MVYSRARIDQRHEDSKKIWYTQFFLKYFLLCLHPRHRIISATLKFYSNQSVSTPASDHQKKLSG